MIRRAVFGVPTPVALRALNAVLVVQSHVEPNRTVKRTVLVQTQPSQIAIEILTVFGRVKVPIGQAPIRDGSRYTVNQLTNTALAFTCVVGIAVEILGDDHISRQLTPVCWNLAIILLEQGVTTFVLDRCTAQIPLAGGERGSSVVRAELGADF